MSTTIPYELVMIDKLEGGFVQERLEESSAQFSTIQSLQRIWRDVVRLSIGRYRIYGTHSCIKYLKSELKFETVKSVAMSGRILQHLRPHEFRVHCRCVAALDL